MADAPGLLGRKPSRKFKIYREEFPAIFRFNGKLYQEHYNIDTCEDSWIEIDERDAERWTRAGAESSEEPGPYRGIYVKLGDEWFPVDGECVRYLDPILGARFGADGRGIEG